jgi:DNA mismatch repair protein MutS2
MIYPASLEAKTGFDKIRAELMHACISDMGVAHVEQIRFGSNYKKLLPELQLTEEFRNVLMSGRPFPSQDYYDLRNDLKHIVVAGTYLETETMAALGASLRTLCEIVDYAKPLTEEAFPHLKKLIAEVYVPEWIPQRIDSIIDIKGEVRDDASPTLKELRQNQIRQRKLVEKRIRLIYQSLKKEGVADDDAEITIRSGRSVIPLPAANKRRIRGFVHDESASGQTVYIEPEEIFDLNNEIREMEAAERREIIRILTVFADDLRPESPSLILSYEVLGRIDFVRAKASFALRINAVLPRFEKIKKLDLKRAINPLLFLSGKHTQKDIVPLDLMLDPTQRILIISGPNAGGKSVCLKTVGVLQYMLQCGLLIPVREDSETGIFDSIFIEIGDEQSIENDLSTYSSHLKNIAFLAEKATSGWLFLIDEFGSGTEPQPGGAIAEAVLEHMSRSGAWGVVSTHYLNLKLMAGNVDGIINGAMLFDTTNLKPLYQLSIGKPGSSFAFEIAAKTGIPKTILEVAENKTGITTLNFEQQLASLENDRRELDKQKQEFDLADDLLTSLIQKYKDLYEKVESSRKQILEEAKGKATELLEQANQKIELTIKEIRETQAEKEKTRTIREELQQFKENISHISTDRGAGKEKRETSEKKSPLIKPIPEKAEIKKAPLRAGGYAIIRGQDTIVEIAGIVGNYATVVNDNIRLKIPLIQLEGCEKPKVRTPVPNKDRFDSIHTKINEKLAAFTPYIDIRGTRVEEALGIVQKFIDDALLVNVKELQILHGKGNGVLRNVIREYLHKLPEVASCKDEAQERGGSGITIVKFRS